MFKAIWASILVAFTVATAAVAAEPIFSWNFDKQEQINTACTLLYIEDDLCATIEYPRLEIATYRGWGLVYGFYAGTDIIYLTPEGLNQPNNGAYKTILHELVHYIDLQYRGYAMRDPVSRCQSETNAWHVSNAYWVATGQPEKADYQWRHRYNCPWMPVDFGDKTYG